MAFDFDLYHGHRTSDAIGVHVEYFDETGSTMDDARRGAAGGNPAGTAYVAGVQTGGRGRLGREWVSADSGLWVTFHLVARDPALAPLFSLAGALAVSDAVRETALLTVDVKWPNDVLHQGRKLAGILAESTFGQRADIFLGIGINVRRTALPDEVASRATSIEDAGGVPPTREALLASLAAALERHTQQLHRSPAVVVEQWRRHLVTLGQRVRLHGVDGATHDGEAVDVTARGELTLRLDDGSLVSFGAGEVTMSPPGGDEAGGLDPAAPRS